MDSLPKCPLIIKASFDTLSTPRRITFPACNTLSYDLFRSKIAQSFSLLPNSSSFKISYTDDDGDTTAIESHADLYEAILYFDAGDVDSIYSSSTGSGVKNGSNGGNSRKVTMRVTVNVEYDGPSLSETGSMFNGHSSVAMSGASTSAASASGWEGSRASTSNWGDGSSVFEDDERGERYGRGREMMNVRSRERYPMSEVSESEYGHPSRRRHGKGRHISRSRSRSRERGHHHYNNYPRPPSSHSTHMQPPFSYMMPHGPPPGPPVPFFPSGPSYPHARPPPLPPSMGMFPPHGPPPHHPWYNPPRPGRDPNVTSLISKLAASRNGSGSGSGSGGGSGRGSVRGGSSGKASTTGSSGSGGSGGTRGTGGTGDTVATSPGQAMATHTPQRQTHQQGAGISGESVTTPKERAQRGVSPASFDYSISMSDGTGRTPALTADDTTSASRDGSSILSLDSHLSLPNNNFEGNHQSLGEGERERERESQKDDWERKSLLSRSDLSCVPNSLLRCSGCRKTMGQIRYVCTLCGPLQPKDPDDDSDDEGEHVNGVGLLSLREDEDIEVVTTVDLDVRGSENGSTNFLQVAEPNLEPGVHIIPVRIDEESELASRDLRRDFVGLEEGTDGTTVKGGFELCADCIEADGLKHALKCAEREKEKAKVVAGGSSNSSGTSVNGNVTTPPGEEVGEGGLVLRHVFGEVMKNEEGEWREVEYADVVNCSICGTGPILHNRFKCLSCPKFELCLNCYRRVEDIHPIHAFLAVPDRPAPPPRFVPLESGTSLEPEQDESLSTESRSVTSEQFREAILRARGIRGSPEASFSNGSPGSSRGERSELPVMPLSEPQKHVDVMCFGCLAEIVGPRFHCAVCPSFDLCAKCESISPPISSPDGYHDQTHILLKIIVPVEPEAIAEANDRARRLTGGEDEESVGSRRRRQGGWDDRDRWQVERAGGGGNGREEFRFHDFGYGPPMGPPPHGPGGMFPNPYWGPPHHGPPRRHHGPPPPSIYLINAGGMNSGEVSTALALEPMTFRREAESVHDDVLCNGCDRAIVGLRWLCANCPTVPSFNLCEDCEKSSQLIHDPFHAFLRLPRPLEKPLPRLRHLLPILYQKFSRVPSSTSGSIGGMATSSSEDTSLSSVGMMGRDRDPLSGNVVNGYGSSRGGGQGSREGSIEMMTFGGVEEEIVHKAVICDFCMKPIKGAWMCCACCAGSYDLCYSCLENEKISHDQRHVFLKLIRAVDMVHFKDLTNLHAASPKPLLGRIILYDYAH